jgi:hypothetical protein
MFLSSSDPDVATINRKIESGRLDLQPDFQRGEVWSRQKKQRLIDSIIRGWHVPPVHVISLPGTDRQEVLDGQQRLAAIRDFMKDDFPINGNQEPFNEEIDRLDGLCWSELPDDIQSRIEDFTIRVITISDYEPGEPGELFYRLNQPTNLTSAEQRNAYFGPARSQVKNLVVDMIETGFSTNSIGFSNSRMAYDDVVAKFLIALEYETLSLKLSASVVTSRYRESDGFDDEVMGVAGKSIKALEEFIRGEDSRVKLNKATMFSWLIFISTAIKRSVKKGVVRSYFTEFESMRYGYLPAMADSFPVKALIDIYSDRASSRVADISSVKIRDVVLWLLFYVISDVRADKSTGKLIKHLSLLNPNDLYVSDRCEEIISGFIIESAWGDAL